MATGITTRKNWTLILMEIVIKKLYIGRNLLILPVFRSTSFLPRHFLFSGFINDVHFSDPLGSEFSNAMVLNCLFR